MPRQLRWTLTKHAIADNHSLKMVLVYFVVLAAYENEPDVPDIVHPGDWITDENGSGPMMVVKVTNHQQSKWDYCPGAKSWTIHVLGSGYMTGENVSEHDCGFFNNVVAVGGRLLQLYKLGWSSHEECLIVPKPDYVTVSRSAKALLGRTAQMTMELV